MPQNVGGARRHGVQPGIRQHIQELQQPARAQPARRVNGPPQVAQGLVERRAQEFRRLMDGGPQVGGGHAAERDRPRATPGHLMGLENAARRDPQTPGLRKAQMRTTEGPTDEKNCLGCALGEGNDQWPWHRIGDRHPIKDHELLTHEDVDRADMFMHGGGIPERRIDAYMAEKGYRPSSAPPGQARNVIAAFGKETPVENRDPYLGFVHFAKRTPDGWWESKLGPGITIEHSRPQDVEGPEYGRLRKFYIKD